MLIAAGVGAASGLALLALFSRASAKTLALNGYFALIAMLAVYIGARLVTGSLEAIVAEMVLATVAVIAARLAMDRWLPAIGAAILLHGGYDALVGPSTGVIWWYPPLCAGFDLVVGVGLIALLMRKTTASRID